MSDDFDADVTLRDFLANTEASPWDATLYLGCPYQKLYPRLADRHAQRDGTYSVRKGLHEETERATAGTVSAHSDALMAARMTVLVTGGKSAVLRRGKKSRGRSGQAARRYS